MENRPCFKEYYESNKYSENLLLKVPGANNYWIHGGIILGTYFFAICEIERILVYDLSRDKFLANINVNEMKQNPYKEKPLLRGGNGAGGGMGMSGFPKKFNPSPLLTIVSIKYLPFTSHFSKTYWYSSTKEACVPQLRPAPQNRLVETFLR